jgi:hypothetical protein
MMRFVAVVACLSVALGALGRASGEIPDTILTPDYLWFNWVVMASWLISAGIIAFKGTDR